MKFVTNILKKKITYSIFALLIPLMLSAQTPMAIDTINFTINKKDMGCNHSTLGNAEVIVKQKNPPYTYLWTNGETTPYIRNLEHNTYSVTITDKFGNDTVAKIIIHQLTCEMEPETIFTPNEDGYNDTWSITNAQFFPDALILVYNRWGQKVFEYSGLYQIPWDGKDLFGNPVPDASYYYIVYKDQKDKNVLTKGGVSIVR